MTPHHLAATSSAWSLTAARRTLAERVQAVVDAAGESTQDDGLRSPIWGGRHALGGHGDPVGDRVLSTRVTGRPHRLVLLAADISHRLNHPAQHLTGGGDPLDRIRLSIPAMSDRAAAKTARLLTRLDDRIRRDVPMPLAWTLLGRLPCPACRCRALYVCTAAPEPERTVMCRSGCRCPGGGCPCAMEGAVEGAPHIWPRNRVLGAVAGVTR